MTIYENMKTMTKEEFSDFMFQLYLKGFHDGCKHEDDADWVYYRLADLTMEEWGQVE